MTDALKEAPNKAGLDTTKRSRDFFTTKLLAAHIKANYMTPTEAVNLIDQEVKKMRSALRGDHHG